MKELILIIVVILFLGFLFFLTINKKKERSKDVLNEKINLPKNISNPKEANINSSTLDLVDNKSTTGGFISGQMKQQQKQQDAIIKKNIGWVETKSYEEDVRTTIIKIDDNLSSNKNKKVVTVLVVDDSITVLKYITNILKDYNYSIITKEDGSAAMDYLRMTPIIPDLIISDIEMPKMTGPELIRKIRDEKKFNNTPILLVSSNPSPHLNLLEEGLINGVIQKPFSNKDFLNQLKYLLNN